MKSLAHNLAFIMRLTATRKWPNAKQPNFTKKLAEKRGVNVG